MLGNTFVYPALLFQCRDDCNKVIASGVSVFTRLSFLYTGRQLDFTWEDAGISLHFPNVSYEGKIEISVSLFRVSEEYCIWPPGYRFMPPASATYKITANATLPAPVKIRMQHCAVIDKEDSLVHMVAHGGPSFKFQIVNEGKFTLGDSYSEIEVRKFSIRTILNNIFTFQSSLAIHVVYFRDSTVHFAVTKNIAAYRTAVKEEYRSATKIVPYTTVFYLTTTYITFSEASSNQERWSINMAPTPAKINMNVIHEYEAGSVIPHIEVKLEWKGEGLPQKEDVHIKVEGGDMEYFPLSCNPTEDQASSHNQPLRTPDEELTGERC